MNSLASLKSEIIDLVDTHFVQQLSDFPESKKDKSLHNAVGMASLDVLTSQTMQGNVEKRNGLQKEIGDLGTFWNEKSINEMRKEKKKERRKRKSEPMILFLNSHIVQLRLIRLSNSQASSQKIYSIGAIFGQYGGCVTT